MVETAMEWRDRWASMGGGQTINALQEMGQLTAEIICRTIFGRQLGREYAYQIVDAFSEYQRAIGQIDLISLLGLPDWLPRQYGSAVRRSVRRINEVLDQIIGNYGRQRGQDEGTVIGQLLDARDPETGEALDATGLRNETAVLLMAGHETTANLLAWTWYLLSQAPEVEARLHAEIDSVLRGNLPTLADVPRLTYTRAVLDETLRLYPPVPILSREALSAEVFRGKCIPKGSLVLVVPWLLHRHRKLWEKPDHFIPERFLSEGGLPQSKFAYVPFSIGPRICAGLSFGQAEATFCLATLAQQFRLRLEPGRQIRPVARLTLRPEGGLYMQVHRRDPAEFANEWTGTAARYCPVVHG